MDTPFLTMSGISKVFPGVVALDRAELFADSGRVTALIWDARFSLVTALLAGFGRAAAEVGAIIIVGGNVRGYTRTMTTAIALETSKGDLPLALGLGLILLTLSVVVSTVAFLLVGGVGKK